VSDGTTTLRTATLQRSDLLAAQERNDEALALVDEALAQLPDDVALLQQRGWVLMRLGRHTDAVQSLRTALAMAPDAVWAQHLLAVALTALGDLPAASEAIANCLAVQPDVPEHHLQQALILAKTRGLRGRRQRADQAVEHLRTAIALDPERAASYGRAASVYNLLQRSAEAIEHVEKGLALAPDDVSLIAAHADYTAPKVTHKYDYVTGPAHQVASASRVLANAPQHLSARRALFDALWVRRILALDTPLVVAPIVTFAIGMSFATAGENTMPLLLMLLIAAAVIAGGRWAVSRAITKHASESYRRTLLHDLPHSALKRWLTRASWALLGATSVVLLFVRDPIIIRWAIVAVGLSVLLALAASLTQHLTFPTVARRLAAISDDAHALAHLAWHRAVLRDRVTLRVFAALFLAAFTQAVKTGREDAAPVLLLAAAALLLSPLVGLIVVRRVERDLRNHLAGTVDLPPKYRKPGIVGLSLILIAGMLCIVQLVASTASLPVLPNEHDADGAYELTWSPPDSEKSDDACSGRPATRAACILRKQQERQEKLKDRPIPKITPIEIPTMPTLPTLPEPTGH